jgi:hypothetical protein
MTKMCIPPLHLPQEVDLLAMLTGGPRGMMLDLVLTPLSGRMRQLMRRELILSKLVLGRPNSR